LELARAKKDRKNFSRFILTQPSILKTIDK
jgi:hypothetical protein